MGSVDDEGLPPAAQGGPLLAIVCWPELRTTGSFGEPKAELPVDLPHAWAPFPAAARRDLMGGVVAEFSGASVSFRPAGFPAVPPSVGLRLPAWHVAVGVEISP